MTKILNKIWTGLTFLAKYLFLLPYPHLQTPSQMAWCIGAGLLLVVLSGVEAIAWGYLGCGFFPDWRGYVSGFLLGGIVLAGIVVADRGILVLDVASKELEADVNKEIGKAPKPDAKPATWWQQKKTLVFAFGSRTVIVALSMIVTAPNLAQLSFRDDINAAIQASRDKAVSAARSKIVAGHDAEIGKVQDEISQDWVLYGLESGGKKGVKTRKDLRVPTTGQPGIGPAALAIKSRIDAADARLRELNAVKESELTRFDRWLMERNYASIRETWGVELAENTLTTREEAIMKLNENPAFVRTSFNIKAFLVILFLVQLLSKILQPAEVAFYFSSYAQDRYEEYQTGKFDSVLLPQEYSGRGMTATRFREFLVTEYVVWHLHNKSDDAYQEKIKQEQQFLTDELGKKNKDLDECLKEVRDRKEEASKLGRTLKNRQEKVAGLQENLKQAKQSKQALAAALRGGTPDPELFPVLSQLSQRISEIEAQIALAQDGVDELEIQCGLDEQRLSRVEDEVKRLDTAVKDLQGKLEQVDQEAFEHQEERKKNAAKVRNLASVVPDTKKTA